MNEGIDALRGIALNAPNQALGTVVLDTNIVLDVFLFQDPRTEALRRQLFSKQVVWVATAHMRNELERVLTYAHIATKLTFYQLQAQDILCQFDRWASIHAATVTKAPYACKDTDDQVFIDLACALAGRSLQTDFKATLARVTLLSKDKAVLSMRKRLLQLSVCVSSGDVT